MTVKPRQYTGTARRIENAQVAVYLGSEVVDARARGSPSGAAALAGGAAVGGRGGPCRAPR